MIHNLTYNLPDDNASNYEKSLKSYGKEIALFIDSEWFSSGRLNSKRAWIKENRAYSRGEQTTDYKTQIEGKREGRALEIKTHKIDYTRKLKIMLGFKDTIVNSIDESLFKPRAEAIDIKAVNTKKDYFKKLDKDFYTKDIANVISAGIGIQLTPENTPQTEKDLTVKKLEYKPDIEIAQELAIENVMKHQKIEGIKDKCDEDLFDIGHAVAKVYTDNTEGIKLNYVDPFNHGCSDFEYDDGRDIRYHFEVKRETITNLAKLAGGLDKDSLKKLKNRAINDLNSNIDYDESLDGNRLVEYIHFTWILGKGEIYKRKTRPNKSTKLINRSNDEVEYNPQRESSKLEIPYNTWYEGVYVPQDEIMIKWEEVDNQIVDGIGQPICPFMIVAPKVKRISEKGQVRFDSMIDRAKPMIDAIQIDWFKLQQLKTELRPNTVELDTDAINNVTLNGERMDPELIIDLFFGRGLLLKNKYDEEGDENNNAINEIGGGINNTALGFLSNEFSNNYLRLERFLGINSLRDGSINQSDRTPAKVQKLLLASSNNNTSHIVKASFNLSLMFATAISLRLKDVLESENLRDMYMNIIGTDNVELLDVLKDIPMHHFGIYFDFKPDDEERVAFENSIINAFNDKEINSAQYNTARQIRNVKNAIKYLGITIEENVEKKHAMEMQKQKLQGQVNAESTLVSERAKQQSTTIQWDVRKQEMLLQDELDAKKEIRSARIKNLLAEEQSVRNERLEYIKGQNTINYQGVDNQMKKERIDQVATNTSKIADQKANKKPPINFNDSLEEILR